MTSDYLFDIGNVILFFDFTKFARGIEAHSSLSAEGIMSAFADNRAEFEGKALSADEFLAVAMTLSGYSGPPKLFVKAWNEIFTLNPPIADWIGQLASEGNRLFLFSNTNQLHVDYFTQAFPVFSHFQGAIYSHEIGCAKPERKFYETAVSEFGLDPANTVYLDDLAENIATGKEIGFRSVHYLRQPIEDFA